MSEFLTGLLVTYSIVAVVMILLGTVRYADAEHWTDRREGARMVFCAPIWLLVFVAFLIRRVRDMWKAADWKEFKL